MQTLSVKDEARRLVDSLPEDSTWSDVMYEIYVRQEIEKGIADINEGRFIDHAEVKKIFGITE
jgi:predicted transcriptional regulator